MMSVLQRVGMTAHDVAIAWNSYKSVKWFNQLLIKPEQPTKATDLVVRHPLSALYISDIALDDLSSCIVVL